MKAHLLFADRDPDFGAPLPAHADALEQDLELGTILDAMSRDDHYLRRVAERTLLDSLASVEEIRYRQGVLGDCLEHRDLVRALYALAVEGVETKRKARLFWFRDSPDHLLQKSLRVLELLVDVVVRLRALGDQHGGSFSSEGFTAFFAMLRNELDDEYLATMQRHLHELRFPHGTLISARLGPGNRGAAYVLRRPGRRRLRDRLAPGGPPGYRFTIPARDEHGTESLARLRDRGIRAVASTLAQSTDHILAFFAALRAELAFYVACVELHERLVERGQPTCLPEPATPGTFKTRGLYDVALAFHLDGRIVGNDVDADGKQLTVITGANQGGKSTFLRSVGIAQLMFQAGMFVGAESFSAGTASGVFTHFTREEDPTMTSGRLEEELRRMSEIADVIRPGSLLLCNESFASTNEREGSEIGRQVLGAMVDAGVRVFLVTHLYDLAKRMDRDRSADALFLLAERKPDGRRTFRVVPGTPQPTSYADDSYRRVFGVDLRSRP